MSAAAQTPRNGSTAERERHRRPPRRFLVGKARQERSCAGSPIQVVRLGAGKRCQQSATATERDARLAEVVDALVSKTRLRDESLGSIPRSGTKRLPPADAMVEVAIRRWPAHSGEVGTPTPGRSGSHNVPRHTRPAVRTRPPKSASSQTPYLV